jgi:small subunit ribosomal protein S20
MANHKSAIKRNRQSDRKKLQNRYFAKTARNAIKELRANTNKTEAQTLLPKVSAMLDKLAKKNLIHANKASNLKSSLAKHTNSI